VEGLIHLSELAEGNVTDPSQVVHEGEQVTALVLAVDPGEHRLSLSLRQVPRPPEASGRPEDLSEGEVSSEEIEEVEERQSEDGLQG
ncbi:MAG: S1 RNA-binding domain-containing protein, partial [Anaerolineae bacterium]|nr:S1 RNA-binding domain-containing protein [Anaerolineae bacterium]